jgi:hypothetical protein
VRCRRQRVRHAALGLARAALLPRLCVPASCAGPGALRGRRCQVPALQRAVAASCSCVDAPRLLAHIDAEDLEDAERARWEMRSGEQPRGMHRRTSVAAKWRSNSDASDAFGGAAVGPAALGAALTPAPAYVAAPSSWCTSGAPARAGGAAPRRRGCCRGGGGGAGVRSLRSADGRGARRLRQKLVCWAALSCVCAWNASCLCTPTANELMPATPQEAIAKRALSQTVTPPASRLHLSLALTPRRVGGVVRGRASRAARPTRRHAWAAAAGTRCGTPKRQVVADNSPLRARLVPLTGTLL